MKIDIVAKYFQHDGGTKFYEIITFCNVEAKRYVNVYRWGKKSVRVGGGESKVERFYDGRDAYGAAMKKAHEKMGRQYSETTAGFGLHHREVILEKESTRLLLGQHYHDVLTIDSIMDGLGAGDELAHLVTGSPDDDVIIEEPAPEPERGGEWASW